MAHSDILFRAARGKANPTPKIIAVMRNFAAHIAELNNTPTQKPTFFLKPPSSIFLEGNGPILIPRNPDDRTKFLNVHHE
eukprot:gene1931-12926_t